MCGIMGYYSFGNTVPDKKKIEKMFVLLETRGKDASGFAFIDPITSKLIVTKAAVSSSKLVRTKEWNSLALTSMMIFHTRMKTQGEPSNNMNNHPLFTKDGLAIVHNGHIHNDDEIFGIKQKRDAQVDSEAILAVLSKSKIKEDTLKCLFETLDGAFAVAMINQNVPDKLTLVKKDNPIELYYNSEDDILYFASEREMMQEALGIRPHRLRGFGIGENNYHHFEVEDNYALVINPDGIESYKKYKPRYSYGFGFDQSWELDDSILMECPFCRSMTYFNVDKSENKCQHCHQYITEEDIYV